MSKEPCLTYVTWPDKNLKKGICITKAELAKAIYDISHLTGEFLLRSGQTSNEYFDKYRFEAQPTLLDAIANELVKLIPEGIDALAGLEVGGIPLATAMSLKTGLPVVFVRKQAKNYGTCKLAEGIDIEGKNLLVVEDVITTGGQVIESTKDLRNRGAIVKHAICVIYRGQGVPKKLHDINLNIQHLFTMEELKKI